MVFFPFDRKISDWSVHRDIFKIVCESYTLYRMTWKKCFRFRMCRFGHFSWVSVSENAHVKKYNILSSCKVLKFNIIISRRFAIYNFFFCLVNFKRGVNLNFFLKSQVPSLNEKNSHLIFWVANEIGERNKSFGFFQLFSSTCISNLICLN